MPGKHSKPENFTSNTHIVLFLAKRKVTLVLQTEKRKKDYPIWLMLV